VDRRGAGAGLAVRDQPRSPEAAAGRPAVPGWLGVAFLLVLEALLYVVMCDVMCCHD
jgi:hypothetical protein